MRGEYQGGRIYRNVYLVKTAPVAIGLWGVYVMPQKQGDIWVTNVETEIINDTYEAVTVEAVSEFFDDENNKAGEGRGSVKIQLREKGKASYCIKIKEPKLWDLENPHLYTVVTRLYKKR